MCYRADKDPPLPEEYWQGKYTEKMTSKLKPADRFHLSELLFLLICAASLFFLLTRDRKDVKSMEVQQQQISEHLKESK